MGQRLDPLSAFLEVQPLLKTPVAVAVMVARPTLCPRHALKAERFHRLDQVVKVDVLDMALLDATDKCQPRRPRATWHCNALEALQSALAEVGVIAEWMDGTNRHE